jgi:DNA-binding response OmpR family regulator
MRILLVEDQPEMVTALRAALARHDMLVDHAPNLSEAEVITAEGNYDAIVLDRRLPDCDGLSLIPKLRESGNAAPVLVLTARDELADRVSGLDSSADDYLGKPFVNKRRSRGLTHSR